MRRKPPLGGGVERRWLLPIDRYGHLARATVFAIIGGFLLMAAVRYDAREALGLGGSLRALQQSGRVLLAVTAAGLLAFGAINLSRRLTGASVRPQGASSNGTRGFRPSRAPTGTLSVGRWRPEANGTCPGWRTC